MSALSFHQSEPPECSASAMGAAESRSLTSTSSDVNIRGRIGFHVLRVADGSPAAVAGIEAYFDYVVGVSGQPFNAATHAGHGGGNIEEMLAGIVDDHEGRQLSLQVWSSKRADLRGAMTFHWRHCAQADVIVLVRRRDCGSIARVVGTRRINIGNATIAAGSVSAAVQSGRGSRKGVARS